MGMWNLGNSDEDIDVEQSSGSPEVTNPETSSSPRGKGSCQGPIRTYWLVDYHKNKHGRSNVTK